MDRLSDSVNTLLLEEYFIKILEESGKFQERGLLLPGNRIIVNSVIYSNLPSGQSSNNFIHESMNVLGVSCQNPVVLLPG